MKATPASRSWFLWLMAIVMGLPMALVAQTPRPPDRMIYQGYIVGADSLPLGSSAPKAYDLILRIYDAESSGNLLWAEQQTAVVDNGNFGVQIGEGIAVTGFTNSAAGLSSVFVGTSGSDRWVALTVKGIGTGGTDKEILPRVRLASAPYAYLAQAALRLADSNGNELLSASGTNLVASTAVTAPAVAASTLSVGSLSISNSLSILGAGSVTGVGFVSTPEGALRVVAGRHRWTNGVAGNGGTLMLEPSPGYSIQRVSAGEYKITFDTAFNSIPSIVANALTPASYQTSSSGLGQCQVIQSTDATTAKKEFNLRILSHSYPTTRAFYYITVPVGGLTTGTVFTTSNTSYRNFFNPGPVQPDWDFTFIATGT